jgi:hypothetical protein
LNGLNFNDEDRYKIQLLHFIIPFKLDENIVKLFTAINKGDVEDMAWILRRELEMVTSTSIFILLRKTKHSQ